jgi:hypothetical protein
MENTNTPKKLVIIAGAAGEIGTAYIKDLIKKDIECIGVIRTRSVEGVDSPLFRSVVCNLDSIQEIAREFESVDFSKYNQIVYLHTIGVDKFDPRGYPNIRPMATIDADIYNTNVNSFKYLFRYCVERVRDVNNSGRKLNLKSVIIAGVADKYTPFVIESFCEAKFILRQYIQSAVGLYPEWCSGLSINITSTITKSALVVRKFAETDFWLTPEEVVNQSQWELVAGNKGYKEIDIIKNSPQFIQGYYENNKVLYEKWSKETGIK